MDMLSSGELTPTILTSEEKFKNRSLFANFKEMNDIRARFVREDTFYATYYPEAIKESVDGGKMVDGYMYSDIFLLLDHAFESIVINRKKVYMEWFIKGQCNKLTGMSLQEFFSMTEKEVRELMEVVDDYNRAQLKEHVKAEKELKSGM